MKKYLILATIVAMAFVGCKKQTTAPTKEPVDKRVAVRFTGAKVLDADILTRVTADGKWEAGDKIGVTAFKKNSNYGSVDNMPITSRDNVEYVSDNKGEFSPAKIAETLFLPEDGSNMSYTAYYPYQSLPKDYSVSIDCSNQSSHKHTDIFWASAENINSKKPEAQLIFHRMMSLIEVVLQAGPGVKADDIKNAKVVISGIPTKAKFNVLSGSMMSGDAGVGSLSLTATNGKAGFVVPPHSSSNHKARRITVDIGVMGTFTTELTGDILRGKKHKLTMSLRIGHPVKMTATISPWKDESNMVVTPRYTPR